MSSPIRSASPARSSGMRRSRLTRVQRQTDASGGEVGVEVVQPVGGGDVDFDVRFDVEDEPPHGVLGNGGILLVDREEGPPTHVTDVGEEQRGVVPVDDEARQGLRVGIVVHVVHSGQSRHAAEHAFVGASQPVEDLDQAQRDGHADADEDPEQDDTQSGRRCQQQLVGGSGRVARPPATTRLALVA